jgi:chemotaxis family two-component system response regulator Rcp1
MDILLVEDSPGDVRLTLEVFQDTNPSVGLHIAKDGTEAMSFLRKEGVHANVPRPDLILLDLNMPKMDGRQVLTLVKTDENLRLIPIIVLTTSGATEDIATSYKLHANCYLQKPVQLDSFEDLVRGINDFWLNRAKYPLIKQEDIEARASENMLN